MKGSGAHNLLVELNHVVQMEGGCEVLQKELNLLVVREAADVDGVAGWQEAEVSEAAQHNQGKYPQ